MATRTEFVRNLPEEEVSRIVDGWLIKNINPQKVFIDKRWIWAKIGGDLGKDGGRSGKVGWGSGQRRRRVWAKTEGVGRAQHFVRSRLQGVRRRREAGEDLARLA